MIWIFRPIELHLISVQFCILSKPKLNVIEAICNPTNKLLAMLNRQSIIILIILFSTYILRGQEYNVKSFGVGLDGSASLLGYSNSSIQPRLPGFASTPNLFFSVRRHVVTFGLDIYTGATVSDKYFVNKIYGFQMGYKYFLMKNNKAFNLFAECNFRYVEYGLGAVLPVKYNYLPTDYLHQNYNLVRTKSIFNTYGIGMTYTLFNRLILQLCVTGGYNFYKSNYAPTNTRHENLANYSVDSRTVSVIFADIGISYKLWRR